MKRESWLAMGFGQPTLVSQLTAYAAMQCGDQFEWVVIAPLFHLLAGMAVTACSRRLDGMALNALALAASVCWMFSTIAKPGTL